MKVKKQKKDTLEEVLKHYGRKGMKWGVIHDYSAEYRAARAAGMSRLASRVHSSQMAAAKSWSETGDKAREKAARIRGDDPKSKAKRDALTVKANECEAKASTIAAASKAKVKKAAARRAARKAGKAGKKIAPTENPVKKMSDSELRQKVQRLQLEKQYATLLAGSTAQRSSGKAFVQTALLNGVRGGLTSYTSSTVVKVVSAIVDASVKAIV